jgi:hypothetical protein
VTEERRYRFGPLERRGLVAGWRGGQIASVAGGLLLAVLAVHSRPDVAGGVVALVGVGAGVGLACWPISGRTGEEWLPTVARWSLDGAAHRRRTLSPAPGDGTQSSTVPASAPTASTTGHRGRGGPFSGLSLLSLAPQGGAGSGSAPAVGVIHDAGGRTYTAALSIRGRSFTLLGPDEKEHRIGGWAGVLASLARERSPVHRLQWIASTVPDDGRGVRAHLAERAVLDPSHAAYRSYCGVLGVAGTSASRHEVVVALQVKADRRLQRAARAAGEGGEGTGVVLLRELDALARQMADADMTVEGVLGPAELAAIVRRAGQAAPAGTTVVPGIRPSAASADVSRWPWPMAMEAEWGQLHTDETWHATYWIAEWPRVDVGPDFLGPLLLAPGRRTVAVVMEPLSPSRAVRQVEQARTADLADSEMRRRGGFLDTARRSREAELVARREVELADGHASFRFSGYVTVTAATRQSLDEACEITEQAAGQARLELRRLFGDQARGFTCALPLCRGLS